MERDRLLTKRNRRRRYGQALIAVTVTAALLQPFSTAEAGLVDRVKDIYRLPEQVESMQKEYDAAKQQLEEQKEKLSETVRQSKETEERLIAQNKQLQQQNEALQKRLQAMEQAAADKNAFARKITMITVTAVILILGYFVLGRLLRVAVWRRRKKAVKL
ncbi:MAG: hypothetical protein K0S39_998 [Paenibacillus sp.]|jgi:chromosome segregation ATPase|nr:hypothetical protein [Paenibacillus sp.]